MFLSISSLGLLLSGLSFLENSDACEPSPGVFSCLADGTAEQAIASYTPVDSEYLSYKSKNNNKTYHDYVGNIYDVWDSCKGDGIRVAVIDSGIDTDHPDFFDEIGNSIIDYNTAAFITHVTNTKPAGNNFIRSRDTNGNLASSGSILRFYTNTEGANFSIDGDLIPIRDIITHWDGVQGTHGTSVASTIASYPHESSHVGTIGIAPKVTLVPIKIDFFTDTIGDALKYVHELNTNSNPDDDIDIVNISIEATSTYYTIADYAEDCVNDGTIIFASGGNHNTSTKYYPASDPYIIGVGALEKFSLDTKASYSNFNATFNTNWRNNVDITMVGNVYVAEDGGTYKEIQGTSFSSPICAAGAALWKQKNPNKTYSEFLTDLVDACIDIGTTGNDATFGYGRLDISRLVGLDNIVVPTSLSMTSETLEMEVDDSVQLVLSGTPEDANLNATWSSSNSKIVEVDENGLLLAKHSGTAVITATSIYNANLKATCAITVLGNYYPVEGIVLDSDEELTLKIGQKSQILAHVTPTNAGNQNLEYQVDDEEIVSVSDTGLITGLAEGEAYIQVSSVEDLAISEVIFVTVEKNPAPVVKTYSFTINPTDMPSSYGNETEKTSTAKNISDSSDTKTIKWAVYNGMYESSAKVVQLKNSPKGYIYNKTSLGSIVSISIANGTNFATYYGNTAHPTSGTDIGCPYFTLESNGGAARSSGITVTFTESSGSDPTVSSVTISGATSGQSLAIGNTLQLSATVNGSNNPSQSVQWTTSNSNATVSSSGLVTGVYSGNVTIYAASTVDYSKVGSIDLVISNGSNPDDYYADARNKTSSQSQLAAALHSIISTGTKDVGYGNLFNAYKTTDVKPGTNYLWDMYSNINYTTNDSRINKNYDSEGDSINREHTIPQSWFNEASPMVSDLFHVYPTDGYVNNRRSNYPHGDVTNASWTSANGSKLGTGSNTAVNNLLGSDKKLFEPIDEYKGDFARTYFYFATRYCDKISSFSTEGKRMFQTSLPYLKDPFVDMYYAWHIADPVSQKEIDRNNAVYAIQGNRNPYIDNPTWVNIVFNGEVPAKTLTSISVSENHRDFFVGNDFVKETVTATYSDGSHADVTSSAAFSGYNMSNSGTQTVSVSYTENGVTKDTTYNIQVNVPKVTNLTLNTYTASLDVYGTPSTKLTASVTAQEGADQTVSWSIVDGSQYVSLSATTGTSITVTGSKAGSATIRATAGDCYKDCVIEVADSTPVLVQSITISGSNTLIEGSSTKLSVSVSPGDATNKEVTWSSSNSNITVSQDGTVNAPNNSHGQTTTITATAKDGSGVSGIFVITITEQVTINSISIEYTGVDGEAKVSFARYPAGTDLDARVIAHLSNGETQDITDSATKNFKINYLKLGYQKITASYAGFSQVSLNVFVTNKGSSEYVGIASKVTRAAGSYNATPEMQAQAWAEYFITVTGGGLNNGPCKLPTEEQRDQALQAVWGGLSEEYGWMAPASKDVFYGSTTNAKIVEAREHYKYIVKTYTSLDKFVKNSSDTVLSVANSNSALEKFRDISIIVAAVLFVAGGAVLIVYFTFRKRKTR